MGDATRVPRLPFSDRRVILGVTGGIAAFKAVHVARELTLAGAAVDVIQTQGSLEFVRPLSFEALTGRPVFIHGHEPGDPLLHIRLASEADLVLVAPATADFLARAAAGLADDLLTTVLLATPAPVVLCPAMNDRMYAHPQTRANLERLAAIGYRIAGPAEGLLAWGEGTGRGRMIEPVEVLDHAARALSGSTSLAGRRLLVTAGPTREPIDPVRFIGNRSSGRMGFAIAAQGWRLGADVTLISGPSHFPTPTGVHRIDVETAEEMRDAVAGELPQAEVLVMAAAVADFRPAEPAAQKIKRGGDHAPEIRLEPAPDVLRSTMELRPPKAIVVGFALETENALENARRKLEDKRLDLLVLNNAREPGAGFEVSTNRVTLIDPSGGIEEVPLQSKEAVAERILARVASLLSERAA